MSDRPFDVTLVINNHASDRYLYRTMTSLEEAVLCARGQGLRVEAVLIMNQSPPSTLGWVRRYDGSAFDRIRIVEVDNPSLGLSRNDGLRHAEGEYILFADDDDLISANSIVAFHKVATGSGPDTIVVPQYLFGFGSAHLLAEYKGTDQASNLSFIKYHPYVSRLFVHHSIRDRMQYADVQLTRGYSFEDWHFNATAVANGYSFASAPDTILFYRQRTGGMYQVGNMISTRQIPPTPFFEPKTYLRVCRASFDAFESGSAFRADVEEVRRAFLASATCQVMTHAANRIDPAIVWDRVNDTVILPNTAGDYRLGAAYYKACRLIGARRFTDIVLAPALVQGAALNRLRAILAGLTALDPGARCLVLIGEAGSTHSDTLLEIDRVTVVDLAELCAELPPPELDIATLRLVESTSTRPRLHLFSSTYAHRFFNDYKIVLAEMRPIYYRAPDHIRRAGSFIWEDGANFDFMSDNVLALDTIVTDGSGQEERDRRRLDIAGPRWLRLPHVPRRALPQTSQQIAASDSSKMRVLWQEDGLDDPNYHRVRQVAQRLLDLGSNVVIDLSSSAPATSSGDWPSNVDVIVSDCSFSGLNGRGYAAFVWACRCQGVPADVIEAVADGVPMIAANQSELDELLIEGKTGYRITCDKDAVEQYVALILRITNDPAERRRLRDRTRQFAREHYSWRAFLQSLSTLIDRSSSGTSATE